MRERWARIVALLTGLAIVALAATFAWWRNAPQRPLPTSSTAIGEAARVRRGAELFDSRGCVRCHAFAGHGNPRGALDGVAARLDVRTIRDRIIAAPAVAAVMPRRAVVAKQAYADLTADDLDALVTYLQQATAPEAPPRSIH